MTLKAWSFVGVAAFVVLASADCSPTEPIGVGGGGDCSPDPFTCKADETCWPNDDVSKFICQPGRPGTAIGDSCDFIGGQVVCPALSVCIVQGASGVCTPYCDPDHDHPCPGFATCLAYEIDAPNMKTFTVHACDAVTIGTTASTGAGG
jgi:hypothetical protein